MEGPNIKYFNYFWFDSYTFSPTKVNENLSKINLNLSTLTKFINTYHFHSLSEFIKSDALQDNLSNLPSIIIYSEDLRNDVFEYFREIKNIKAYISFKSNSDDIEFLRSFSSEKFVKNATSIEELENHLRNLLIKEHIKDFSLANDMIYCAEMVNHVQNLTRDNKISNFSFEKILFVSNQIEFNSEYSFFCYKQTIRESEGLDMNICNFVNINSNLKLNNHENLKEYSFFEKNFHFIKVNYFPDENFQIFKYNIIQSFYNKENIHKDEDFIYNNYINKFESINDCQEICRKVFSMFILRNEENNFAHLIFNNTINNIFKYVKLDKLESFKHIILAILLNFHKCYSQKKLLNGRVYKYINLMDSDKLEEGKIIFFNQFLPTNLEKLNKADKEMENWLFKNKNSKIEIELEYSDGNFLYNNFMDISELITEYKIREKVILFAPFTSFLITQVETNPHNNKKILKLKMLPNNNFMNFSLTLPLGFINSDKFIERRLNTKIEYLKSLLEIDESYCEQKSIYQVKLIQAIARLNALLLNYNVSLSYFIKSKKLEEENLGENEFLYYVDKGYCHLDNNESEDALVNFNIAKDLIEERNLDKFYNLKVCECFVDYYQLINDRRKTIDQMKRYVETSNIYESLYSLGMVNLYRRVTRYILKNDAVEDYEYALEILFRCKKIYKANFEELGKVYIKIGKLFEKTKNFDKAIDFYLLSKQNFTKLGDRNVNLAKSYYLLSNIYFILGKYDLTFKINQLAKGISKDNSYPNIKLSSCEIQSNRNICEIYIKKLNAKVDSNILKEALIHSKTYLKLLQKKMKHEKVEEQSFVHKILSKLYSYKNDLIREKENIEEAINIEKGICQNSEEVLILYIQLAKILEKIRNLNNNLNNLEICYEIILSLCKRFMEKEEIKTQLDGIYYNYANTLYCNKKFSKAKVNYIISEKISLNSGQSSSLYYCRILKLIGICSFEVNEISDAELYLKLSEDLLLNKFTFKYNSELCEVGLYQAKIFLKKKQYEESVKKCMEALKYEKVEVKRLAIYENLLDVYKFFNKNSLINETEIKICEIKITEQGEKSLEILNYFEKFSKYYENILLANEKARKNNNEKDLLLYHEYNARHLMIEMSLNLLDYNSFREKQKHTLDQNSYLDNYSELQETNRICMFFKSKLKEQCLRFTNQMFSDYVLFISTNFKSIILSTNYRRVLTENYLRARKCFCKVITEFLLNYLLTDENENYLNNLINQITSFKELKTIEEKGPFISSTIITQIIRAETLGNLGFREKSLKYMKESIDSYNNILSTYPQNNYIIKATLLRKLSELYRKDKKLSQCREFLEKTKNIYTERSYAKYFEIIADINFEIALSHFTEKDYNESINYFEQALSVLKNNKDENSMQKAEIQKYLGICFYRKGDLEEALNYYYKSLDIITNLNNENEEEAFYLYYLICMIFVKKHDYFVSLEYLKKAKGILYIQNDTLFKNQFLEFYLNYRKYLDFIDENIWTNYCFESK